MSLLAWYPLNGDTKDYSGNNRHMNSNNIKTDSQGKIGQCYNFDGTAIMFNEGWNLNTGNIYDNFTATAWIYPTEYPSTNGFNILSFNGNNVLRFRLNSNKGIWILWGGQNQTGFSTLEYNNIISLNTWTHICCRLKDKKMSLFINGKLITTQGNAPIIMNNSTFIIGGYNTELREVWRGKLNDIRLYDEALTAMQIKEIAQAKICHYTCNEQMYENTANLLNNRNQITDNGVIEKKWINDHHIEFAVEANTSYKGICLSTALAAKPLTNYTFSYKIQKIKGTLNRIRGHIESQSFNEISAKIDGISFGYTAGYNVLDNHDTHKVEVTISTKENITNLNKIYIQPNDTTNDYVKVRVWDIQVEEKDHATLFTPNTRVATLKDISGFGYDMTPPVEYSPTWKNDEKKSYFELKDKANFYVDKPFSSFLRQFTYSAWVRTSDTDAYCVIGQPYGSNSDFSLAIIGNRLCLHSYTVSNYSELCDEDIALTDENVNDNRWHLLTATYDGINVKTYIDGVLKKTQPYTFKFDRYMSTSLSIGSKDHVNLDSYEWRRFEGDIRDVRVYATALSDEDIKLLYQPEVIIDKSNTIRCSEINESFKTIKKHIEIKSKGFELKANAKVIIDNYTRIIDTIGWEVIEIKKDNTINVTPFSTHASNNKFVDLMNYIKQLDKHSIIILATKDQPSGNPNMNANNSCISFVNYLNSIGSSMTKDFPFRGAYAGIIYNGQIVKEKISYEGVNSSAEIILDELVIDSAILDDSTFNGFNKNATLNFKEFSEIPEIQSGVHNLKLGNNILPVLIDMDNDGGRWARIFYHNNKAGTVMFSRDNDWAEAKETNINNPITSDKYSILSKLEYFRQTTNNYFEFRLKYPTDVPNECNIWKQKSNPTYQKVKDYYPIKISWNYRFWGGLEYSNNPTSAAFIDGSVNVDNWYYAIATYNKYRYGMPNFGKLDNDDSTPNDVELWIRINDFDLFTDINQEIAINSKTLTAKEFKEIY